MIIKGIRVEFSFTKNLGNYNSIKINEALEVELNDKDNLNDVRDIIYIDIKSSIKKQLKKIKEMK